MYREKSKHPLLVLLSDEIGGHGLAIAQACHAAYGFGQEHPDVVTNNYCYILRASRGDIELWKEILEFEKAPFYLFAEKDLGDIPTALCCSTNPNRMNRLKKY